MKIGLFGGTFNPPHKTHVNIAFEAKRQLALDKLIVMPCGDPPHKKCLIDKERRLQMSQIAFGSFAEVSDYEIMQSGKSYTLYTLQMLQQLYPNDQLYLIIGGDSFVNFGKWYKPHEIAKLATIAVAERAGNSLDVDAIAKQFDANVCKIVIEQSNVSSSQIKLDCQFDFPIDDFVSEGVSQYIKDNNLYANHKPLVQKLKTYLSNKRFMHSYYVVKRGLEIASHLDYDTVFVACLLHDCAKYITAEQYAKYNYEPQPNVPEWVVHAFLGAKVAQKDFGVIDQEILDAIYYHCTARPEMTQLDKVVYVADKTEETRPYPLEHLLIGNVDQMFLNCLLEAYHVSEQRHGDNVYQLTKQAVDYYTKQN